MPKYFTPFGNSVDNEGVGDELLEVVVRNIQDGQQCEPGWDQQKEVGKTILRVGPEQVVIYKRKVQVVTEGTKLAIETQRMLTSTSLTASSEAKGRPTPLSLATKSGVKRRLIPAGPTTGAPSFISGNYHHTSRDTKTIKFNGFRDGTKGMKELVYCSQDSMDK